MVFPSWLLGDKREILGEREERENQARVFRYEPFETQHANPGTSVKGEKPLDFQCPLNTTISFKYISLFFIFKDRK